MHPCCRLTTRRTERRAHDDDPPLCSKPETPNAAKTPDLGSELDEATVLADMPERVDELKLYVLQGEQVRDMVYQTCRMLVTL